MAQHRHKRETNARKVPRAALVAAPVAVLATVSAVTLGLFTQQEPANDTLQAERDTSALTAEVLADRGETASRAGSRRAEAAAIDPAVATKAARTGAKAARKVAAENRERREAREKTAAASAAVKAATKKMWATTDLNLWSSSAADAKNVGLLTEGDKVLVTGRTADGRTEVAFKGKSRWVNDGYLSDEKPVSTQEGVGGKCANGTSVASGVSASITKVHQAVCARWPEITSYGTLRGDGEHSQGRAIDVMVSGDKGWEIANYLRENASALGIEYLIYAQKIWSVERGGEGWRAMSNRGSATANHFDHVHVTVW